MNESHLQLVVRTPRTTVVERRVASIRVPTETGQVGLRARVEPMVLAVEPGLVLVRGESTCLFVGTAGGLLRCDGVTASLLTPLAVHGDDEDAVLKALEAAIAQPSVEMEARETLGRLQSSILRELRHGGQDQLRQAERVR